ncbi:hypothetical protein MSSIT_2305 [Methanosarcina siciliae T4/M]|uniref:Uncharacterized protein n=1 Tax=Methanosarcina siciliae T4/M TaxID=1434120 RepID=A0A0E3P5R0_9EURY|nr:polysialyltransferase family glycosyltransferase [Methanosarcina siciliae]AKB29024.1 hypothetical protein MSSIT_2305 [Methanosarcina siciliae T4/M]
MSTYREIKEDVSQNNLRVRSVYDYESQFNYIEQELLTNSLDFIAFVISPFHALGVDSFLYELFKEKKRKLNGLIIVNSHHKDGILINENHFSCLTFVNASFRYVHKSEELSLFQKSKTAIEIFKGIFNARIGTKATNSLYIISVMSIPPQSFKFFKNKKITSKYIPQYILIDEGIGMYFDKDFWTLVQKYDIKSKTNVSKFKNLDLISKIFSFLVKNITTKFFKPENRYLFTRESKFLSPNWGVISSYREIISLRKDNVSVSMKIDPSSKWAIIATQPFVEYDQINIKDFIHCLNEIIDILVDKKIDIFLKPHPREDIRKYDELIDVNKNIILLDKSFPLENLLQLKPNLIVGFTSTVLLTSYLFYNVLPVSYIDQLMERSDDPLLSITAKGFKNFFGDLVFFGNLNYILES